MTLIQKAKQHSAFPETVSTQQLNLEILSKKSLQLLKGGGDDIIIQEDIIGG